MALAETATHGCWARKVAQQEQELGVFFDTVVVCAITGSTHAGLFR
jgi:1-aminocyclopropane-1-carboxylate deaminase